MWIIKCVSNTWHCQYFMWISANNKHEAQAKNDDTRLIGTRSTMPFEHPACTSTGSDRALKLTTYFIRLSMAFDSAAPKIWITLQNVLTRYFVPKVNWITVFFLCRTIKCLTINGIKCSGKENGASTRKKYHKRLSVDDADAVCWTMEPQTNL